MSPTKKKIKRIPGATYRLQFNRDFNFAKATTILPYLHGLGITDIYASPIFKTPVDSMHGYDVCDPSQINPSLGSPDEFNAFLQKIKELGLGLLLDIVPNHMRADISNDWWFDVLEKGRDSKFAEYFDIDWNPPNHQLTNKILLPVLGDDRAKVLVSEQLDVVFENGGLFIRYFDKRFPLALHSYLKIFDDLRTRLPIKSEAGEAVGKIESQIQNAPNADILEKIKERFSALVHSNETARREWDKVLEDLHEPLKFDSLLAEQHYYLEYWRSGLAEINYRRFFEVSDLVCVNVQRPEVFESTHQLLSCLLNEGKVTGLRVDHPDGLWNPKGYCERLSSLSKGSYVVVEKILSGDEELPRDWPVDGTTGYEFLNQLNGIFVEKENEAAFDEVYRKFTNHVYDYETIVHESKKRILQSSFHSEHCALVRRLKEIAGGSEVGDGFTSGHLEAVVAELIVAFPVYRTYVSEETAAPSPTEVSYVELAVKEARRRNSALNERALRFMADILCLL